ncbi:interleukin-22-like [Hemitrygon akajei]|uniref:interleukin-22-like n=1 Tax=Hemitrygon akajei TaxID=2704970 RepID=UPI003BF9F570
MYSLATVVVLVLGGFAVLGSTAPSLKSRTANAVCQVEEHLLRQMRYKVHALSKDAQKHDEDTETRLMGKDLFQGLEESGSCYVLKEVIDFYLGTVLRSDQLHAKYSHLNDVKEFLAVLMKRHMSACDTEDKTKANKNIERLKQKVEKLGEASKAKVVGELFILLQEITNRCSAAGWKPKHQGK